MNNFLLGLNWLNSELWIYCFVVLLTAHILADFALRGEFLQYGRKGPIQWPGYHLLVFMLVSYVSFMLTKLAWKPSSKDEGVPGAGRIIGIFEAILITTFIVSYQYGAVGLVFTAKSVARFEWLKDQKKTEYFLIGTLSNLTIATLAGLLALWLAGEPLFPK